MMTTTARRVMTSHECPGRYRCRHPFLFFCYVVVVAVVVADIIILTVLTRRADCPTTTRHRCPGRYLRRRCSHRRRRRRRRRRRGALPLPPAVAFASLWSLPPLSSAFAVVAAVIDYMSNLLACSCAVLNLALHPVGCLAQGLTCYSFFLLFLQHF